MLQYKITTTTHIIWSIYFLSATYTGMNNCIYLLLVLLLCISPITSGQKLCKAPAKNLHNGRRSSLNYNYFKIGSTIRYWCNSGFAIQGSGQIKCVNRNGKAVWSAYAPTCVGMYIHDHSYLMYIMCHCFIENRNTQSQR